MLITKPKIKDLNIFLVRHGQSKGNKNVRAYLSTPDRLIGLTQNGREQAKLTGKYLSQFHMSDRNTLVYVSTFKRAIQTAKCMNEFLNLRLHYDDRLTEGNHGLFNGLTPKEKHEKFPTEFGFFTEQRKQKNSFFTAPPMGESPFQVAMRFISFWRDLEQFLCFNPHIKNVIIVAHGMTNSVAQKTLMDYPVEWFENETNPKNGSIIHLETRNHYIKDHGTIFVPPKNVEPDI